MENYLIEKIRAEKQAELEQRRLIESNISYQIYQKNEQAGQLMMEIKLTNPSSRKYLRELKDDLIRVEGELAGLMRALEIFTDGINPKEG